MDHNQHNQDDSNIIHKYLSEQAASDGYLVSVGELGSPIINYFSKDVWDSCVQPRVSFEQPDASEVVASIKLEVLQQISKFRRRVQLVPEFRLLDWMYQVKIRGWDMWLCQNETGKYTLLFPNDY